MSNEPTVDLPVPARVLAIGAHPDDIEFGCGATLAKWSAAGAEVHLLVLTDGAKGTWDPDADPAALAVARVAEQADAAARLGATAVHHTDYVDGELENGTDQRAAVCAVIRTTRPDVVLTHDPWKRYRLHPDHQHAGFLAVDGVVAARDPHFFPDQGIAHHRPSALLLFEADQADHGEDVTGFDGPKLAALESHASQFESTMEITAADEGADRERFARRIRDRLAEAGRRMGVAHAELFARVSPE